MAIQKDKLTVRVTFFEEVLGTCANDPEIHDNFIAHNAPDAPSRAEEIEALGTGEVIERGMTVFPRMEDKLTPFIWDYQIKGFFKDSCSALRSVQGSESKKIKAYKKVIDGNIFVSERKIPFQNYGRIGDCQRPLRGQTAQGVEFTIVCYKHEKYDLPAVVKEWLDFGEMRGMLQWRNSGKGRFRWEEI